MKDKQIMVDCVIEVRQEGLSLYEAVFYTARTFATTKEQITKNLEYLNRVFELATC